jgi:hypothetical protein
MPGVLSVDDFPSVPGKARAELHGIGVGFGFSERRVCERAIERSNGFEKSCLALKVALRKDFLFLAWLLVWFLDRWNLFGRLRFVRLRWSCAVSDDAGESQNPEPFLNARPEARSSRIHKFSPS